MVANVSVHRLTTVNWREHHEPRENPEARRAVQTLQGGLYRALYTATHSETLEPYVVYQALYGERGIWVRPLEMFLSLKEYEGRWVERFAEAPEAD